MPNEANHACPMLDERWRSIVDAFADDLALLDVASGRSWTFSALAREADAAPSGALAKAAIAHPTGTGPGFILDVLRAWRDGAVTCPLDVGQPPPEIAAPAAHMAHLKLTSGTTGAPRCIAFTANQLAADVDSIVRTMGLERGCPSLGVISLAHSYGFSSLVLPLLLHGIPLVLAASALPAAVAEAAANARGAPLTLPAVPALWRAWHDAGAIPARIRLAISAGAPLPLTLEQAVFDRSGLKIHNFLGASECGGIAYDASPVPRTLPHVAGHPLDGVHVASGSDGRLEVRSPAVGLGYWPLDEASLHNGCYRTGDLGEVLPDGSVAVHGRAVDLINVAGRKVSPEVVEAALRSHPAVRECLVLGLPARHERGEHVAAVVAVEGEVSTEALRDHLLARLAPWQVPRAWHVVERLEANGRGKLSRAAWRERLGAA